MKIKITEKTEERLKEIYLYHKREASITIAKKIKDDFLKRIKTLKEYKELGPIGEHLVKLGLGHRKITEGNYKIVYRIEKNIIFITDIFDSRQDSNKQRFLYPTSSTPPLAVYSTPSDHLSVCLLQKAVG
jgi:plasmid stabilization system protein ParE